MSGEVLVSAAWVLVLLVAAGVVAMNRVGAKSEREAEADRQAMRRAAERAGGDS